MRTHALRALLFRILNLIMAKYKQYVKYLEEFAEIRNELNQNNLPDEIIYYTAERN